MISRRAVIFDLDGTLVDSLADLGESMNAVLASRCFPVHDLEAYRKFVGDGVTNLVTRALPRDARTEVCISACVADFEFTYSTRWDLHTRPYAGIDTAVAELKSRGARLGILTNKRQAMASKIISRFFPHGTFAAVLGANQGYPMKPDPAGALELARRLGAGADGRVCYIGDTATDVRTALAAEMNPVGCLWGFRDAAELLDAGARVLVSHPRELVAMVAG